MPRPTKRSVQVEEDILSRLREGENLVSICRTGDEYPNAETWRNWCHADETLALAYAHAREVGEEKIALDTLEIADEEPREYATEHGVRVDPGDVANRKLKIETRLKLLAIWNPGKFGNKVDLTTGGDKFPATGSDEIATKVAGLLAGVRERTKDG